MEKVNQPLKEDERITKEAMAVVISASSIVYATGFWHAWHTGTYFMVKLFTVEAVLAILVVYMATKFFKH